MFSRVLDITRPQHKPDPRESKNIFKTASMRFHRALIMRSSDIGRSWEPRKCSRRALGSAEGAPNSPLGLREGLGRALESSEVGPKAVSGAPRGSRGVLAPPRVPFSSQAARGGLLGKMWVTQGALCLYLLMRFCCFKRLRRRKKLRGN